MTTQSNNGICPACEKRRVNSTCKGCSNDFCRICFSEHEISIEKQFDELADDYDQFRNELHVQQENPTKHSLIRQIDKWQDGAIRQIKRTAEECKRNVLENTNKNMTDITKQLDIFAKEIRDLRQNNETNEIDLNKFRGMLETLVEELMHPSHFSLLYESTAFIDKISISISQYYNKMLC
jgi:flagellar biosynthesis/type III secretory pathway chaperone